jgi:hypothetical protein
MTGWQSKKESSKVRWLGPYAPTDRHADGVTLAEQITILHNTIADLKNSLADKYQCACKKREAELEQMFAYFESEKGE